MVQSDRVGDDMKKAKRIGMELFDDELKVLINASAKIFPISQEDVDTNNNPNNYEYGRVGNHIYRWDTSRWEYIVADDIDIDWADVKSKPTTYPPTIHTHPNDHTHTNKTLLDTITQVLVDKWNTVTGKADLVHTHDDKYYTEVEVDTKLSTKSDTTHKHTEVSITDLDKYTKAEVDTKILTKANVTHSHTEASITNLDKYTKAQVDIKVNAKADTIHEHIEADITNLDRYTKLETDTKLAAKSDATHNHDGAYYKKAEITSLLSAKSDTTHKHTEANITNLDKYTKAETDAKLATKSGTEHTHSALHAHSNKALLDKLIETEAKLTYDLSNLQYIDDIKNGYTEGHAHSNFSLLQSITQALVDGWNSAVNHISDAIKHITSAERTLWNTVSSKEPSFTKNTAFNKNFGTTVGTVAQGNDSRLSDARIPLSHSHNDLYDTKSEIVTALNGKSDTGHTHTDKADKTYVDTELAKKVATTTFTGHTGNTTIHVTQTDKDAWNGKQDALGFTPVNTTDSRLSDARAPTNHSHLIGDLPPYPTSLPANGGNADTVDGLHASSFEPNQLLAQYSKSVGDLPNTYPMGLSYTFVQSTQGWFNYGTVMTVRSFNGGGGTFQMFTPYGASFGGKSLKMRFSDYAISNGNGWQSWVNVAIDPTIGTVKPTDGSMWYKVIG